MTPARRIFPLKKRLAAVNIAGMDKLRISLVAAALLLATSAQSQVLKGEPSQGSVPSGKKVLVDDGTCPPGQIKEVTGGSTVTHIARSSRCIPYGRKK
jgi:hypothetical protein